MVWGKGQMANRDLPIQQTVEKVPQSWGLGVR